MVALWLYFGDVTVGIVSSSLWLQAALEHDGETLVLVGDGLRRVVTDQDLASMMPVIPDNQITQCREFDLFLIQN
jgi:hypothetical protein